jgi:hypothetical protein
MLSMGTPEPRGEKQVTAAQYGGTQARLRWRLNRLRCMTAAEISHRALRALSMHAQRAGLLGSEVAPAPDRIFQRRPWVQPSPQVDVAPYVEAADGIASGRLDVFALHGAEVGMPPRWNVDPKSGIEAPLEYGKLLDYRDPARVGDIKYLWEPNRHMHLVTLAQAYALTKERKYFEAIRVQLESWFESCPHLLGPNWASALEVAIRLINWSITWQLLGGAESPLFKHGPGAQLRSRWLESIYLHAQFVRGHFSLYSSANNHLIGEAAGLFIAALTWPYWPRMRGWLADAKVILEREALLQNAPEGVNREQAVSYHQVCLDFLLFALLAGKKNSQWFSVAYESRIEAMLEFLASIMDAAGNVPMFGDSDDGLVVSLAREAGFCRYRSLLATGAILFRSVEFKAKAGRLDDKTRWLVGAEADAVFEAQNTSPARLPVRRVFPEGGYYVMGCDFETPREIRLVADAGPLGYQTIAAHGHADALSFTLSAGGLEFLIDPGTYAYHTQPQWRRYFRGTGAHNTVRIDGSDQSESGGNFMWLKKARAGCSSWSSTAEQDVFEGWQDGYMRLADPVLHRRRIVLDKAARQVLVEDILEMRGRHEVELLFHCAEPCTVQPSTGGYALRRAGGSIGIELPQAPAALAQTYRGSTQPIFGWVSRQFDHKTPTTTICWRASLTGDSTLRTKISC